MELESQGAEQIYNTMLDSLNSAGFSNEYLKQNLIGFCSNNDIHSMIGNSHHVT